MLNLRVFSRYRRSIVVVFLMGASLLASGCDQTSSPSSTPPTSSSPSSTPSVSSAARDGFGHRAGTDVTGQPGRLNTTSTDDRPRIVAFGDSLTAGAGVAAEEAYPAQLQRQLDSAGYRYRVINAGVSGDTTAGGARRVSWVLRSKPHLVILELGINDALRGLAIQDIRSNLVAIIRDLQGAHVTVVLAGMKLPPNYGDEYSRQFESLYPELAKAYSLTLFPFFLEGVAAKPDLNQADGVHPRGEGYRIIVGNMLKTVQPLLTAQQ